MSIYIYLWMAAYHKKNGISRCTPINRTKHLKKKQNKTIQSCQYSQSSEIENVSFTRLFIALTFLNYCFILAMYKRVTAVH